VNPRVDVIVPCYNYAAYLRICVDSILSQSGVDVRVLVVDDCSSDESPHVGAALARADPRVAFRRHQQNHGHIATYNEGIEWVKAPYLLLISADDLLTPGALSRAVTEMEADPHVGIVSGRQITFSGEPLLPTDYASPGASRMTGPCFIQSVCATGENPVATPTVVARTAIQRQVGGYHRALPHTADLEMWLRFASFGSIVELRAFQAFKRAHDRNMQHSYVRREVGDIVERREAFLTFLARQECPIQDRPGLRRTADESLAASAFWRGSRLFDEGFLADANELFGLAVEWNPAFASRREWRRMQLKRRMGPALWRFLSSAFGRSTVKTGDIRPPKSALSGDRMATTATE
jgi:glycosyltransferase involved in cell wall biosynthesis